MAEAAPNLAWSIQDFELGRRVGSGNFGDVRLARERRTGFVCALKFIRKRRALQLKHQDQIRREIDIQAHLRHPNILSLYGVFWDKEHISVVLEYASGGELYRHLKRQPGNAFDEKTVSSFMMQMIDAIAHCHRAHVMHRDIKPENVLVNSAMRLKLSDFGCAAHTRPEDRRWTLCGTLDYLPPEMVCTDQGHSFPVDVWGLGILAFELLSGTPPFRSGTPNETYRKISEASPAFPEPFSDEARDFITQMVQRQPEDRMSLASAIMHPWLQQNGERS